MTLDPTKRFKIYQQLGEGSFSKIYHAFDKQLKFDVAIKVEKEDKHKKILKIEYEILKSLQGLNHVPALYDFIENSHNKIPNTNDGKETIQTQSSTISQNGINGLNFIVMELLGKNVANYKKSSQSFSSVTAYEILLQMLDAIEDLHEKGYIHRDIKPANFVIKEYRNSSSKNVNNKNDQTDNVMFPNSYKNNLKIYMVDYGLAKIHLDKNSRPLPPKLNTDFRGTLTYASLNAHYKKELSRRDDLWSFFFVILDLLNENLPWRTCKDDKDDIKKVKEICLADPDKKLLLTTSKGKIEILEILNHLKTLNYCDKPNYSFIRKKLNDLKNSEYYRLNGFPNILKTNLNWGEMANYLGKNFGSLGEIELLAHLNKDNYYLPNLGFPSGHFDNLNNFSNNYLNNNNIKPNLDLMSNNISNVPYFCNSSKNYSNLLNYPKNSRDLCQNSNYNSQNPYELLENQFKANFLLSNAPIANIDNMNTMPYMKNNNNSLNINMSYLKNTNNNFCGISENRNKPAMNNTNQSTSNIFYNKMKAANFNNLNSNINNINNMNNNMNPINPQYIDGLFNNLINHSNINVYNNFNNLSTSNKPGVSNITLLESNPPFIQQMNLCNAANPIESEYLSNKNFQLFNQNSNNLPINTNRNINMNIPSGEIIVNNNNPSNKAVPSIPLQENPNMNLNLNKKRKRDESEEFIISNNNNTANNQIFIINQFNKDYLTELEKKLLDILINNTNPSLLNKDNLCIQDLFNSCEKKIISKEFPQNSKFNENDEKNSLTNPNLIKQISKKEYDINNCDKNLINSITQNLNPPLTKSSKCKNLNLIQNSNKEEKFHIDKNEDKNSNLLLNKLNVILDQNKPIKGWENFLSNNFMKDIINQDVNKIVSNCILNLAEKNLETNEKILVKHDRTNFKSNCELNKTQAIFKIEKIKKGK